MEAQPNQYMGDKWELFGGTSGGSLFATVFGWVTIGRLADTAAVAAVAASVTAIVGGVVGFYVTKGLQKIHKRKRK